MEIKQQVQDKVAESDKPEAVHKVVALLKLVVEQDKVEVEDRPEVPVHKVVVVRIKQGRGTELQQQTINEVKQRMRRSGSQELRIANHGRKHSRRGITF